MAIREGRWDCTTCGSTGILGRQKICPNCGNPRPEGTKFYLPQDADEVRDENQLKQARAGADWLCEYCGASNFAMDEICKQCGAPKGASPSQKQKQYALAEIPVSGDNAPPSKPVASIVPQKRGPGRFALGCAAIAGLLIVIVVVSTFLSHRTSEVSVQVQGVSWTRSIQIERYKTLTEEDWSLPSGGRLISQRRDIHHYDHVISHYVTKQREVSEQVQTGTRTYVCGKRDLGNGYFEDVECTEPVYQTRTHTETYQDPVYIDRPVYATKYKYDIDKWVPERSVRSTGKDHHPYWGDVRLGQKEREGNRMETYTVSFLDENGTVQNMDLTQSDWSVLIPGQKVKAKVRGTFHKEYLQLLPAR